MPGIETRKAPQGPQDEPAKPEGANAPPRPAGFQVNPQAPRKQEAPEPVKDDEGKPVVKVVSATETAIPHEDADDAPEPRLDETVPGGRYQVGDKLVNCNGEVLGDAPKSKKK